MFPDEMRTLIDKCAEVWHYLADPHKAEGQCCDYSWRFVMLAAERGMVVSEWSAEGCLAPGRPNEFAGHNYTSYGEIVIDWTARQFWPDLPFPLIEHVAMYASRWRQTTRLAPYILA